MSTLKKISFLLVLTIALSIGLSMSSAFAQEDALTDVTKDKTVVEDDEKVDARDVSEEEQKETETLWTKEERSRAQPLKWVEAPENEDDKEATESEGRPDTTSARTPNRNADAEAERQFPEAWQEMEAEAIEQEKAARSAARSAAAPDVFTRYRGNHHTYMWKLFPWKAVGKLYFKTPWGGSSYCSASVNRNGVIITAAHCLYSRGAGWNTNVSFVPAERYGNAPYGTFTASSYAILTNYVTFGSTRYDVGVIRLNNNSYGNPVYHYTGWLGRSWNFPYNQHLHSVGYPSNLPNGTKHTYICAAESFNGGPNEIAKGCDMKWGSSGGPWLKNYAPYEAGPNNYVNSVVSRAYTTPAQDTFEGPRFSSSNIVPLCGWAGC